MKCITCCIIWVTKPTGTALTSNSVWSWYFSIVLLIHLFIWLSIKITKKLWRNSLVLKTKKYWRNHVLQHQPRSAMSSSFVLRAYSHRVSALTFALVIALTLKRSILVSIALFTPNISVSVKTNVQIQMGSWPIQKRQCWCSV